MGRKVIVIGGGIAGTSVAVELALRGASVTLLERGQPGEGATGASGGMLAPQYEAHGPDAAFRFAVACKEAWPPFLERLERLADWEMGFRTDGMLVANLTEAEEEGALADLAFQAGLGLPGEVLPVEEARRIHPEVSGEVRSWLWLPREAQVDAQRLAVALADAAQGAGVRLVPGAEVVAVGSRGGRVAGVRLAGGEEMGGDAVVLAAGSWSGTVDGLPREIPLRPIRGQMLRLRPREPLPWTMVCSHDGRYLVPRVNGTLLMGSTMEDVGFDDGVTEEGRTLLARAAAALVPALAEATVVEAWAGLRPISADLRPILGPDPELEGLFYATGHGRNGVLYAPLTGRAVADLVLGGSTQVMGEVFGIGRFRAE